MAIYIGGTGSANKLEDYEEGTFSMAEQNGAGVGVTQDDTQYTKIGRLVVLYADYAIGSIVKYNTRPGVKLILIYTHFKKNH